MKEKFKIGDYVKCIGTDIGARSAVIGDKGKIVFIKDNIKGLIYGVEFENERRFKYHTCNGHAEPCHGYWCSEKMLELIRERKPIVIYQNGNEVIAIDKETGKKAIAKCSPDDKFDFNIGAKIAFERLTTGEVNRAAKVGEYVKVLSEDGHGCKKGEILKVNRVFPDGWVEVNGSSFCNTLRRSQYVVVENYEEPSYYNAKVVCTEAYPIFACTKGKIYEVKDGEIKIDNGEILPSDRRLKNLDELMSMSKSKFIEIKE
jgi:hypothetical protein